MSVFKRKKKQESEQELLNKRKLQEKKRANRQILQITYIFVGLFLVLIGYIIHFEVVDSKTVITNSHNLRLQELEKTVVRGKIISSNDKILAQTVTNGEEEERIYPYSRMFAHVVGFYAKGRSGLESRYNLELLTSNSNLFSQIKSNLQGDKSIGDNLYTTLDTRVQKAAYEALSGEKGAIVAMEPDTGKVIAMVSKPDFRPGKVVQNWEELNTDEDSLLVNRATQGLYPPGSTFKVVVALEYMREHPNYKKFQYHCTGHTKINNVKINCIGGEAHGTVDVEEALEESCNTAFVHMAAKLDKNKLAKLALDLMYNSQIPVGIASTSSRFTFSGSSLDSAVPQIAIGQGSTLSTPLQNAVVMSTIANDGKTMQPYLMDKIKNVDGGTVREVSPKEMGDPLTKEECKRLKKMLRKVVTQGTGTGAYTSRYKTYGKTGSAEYNEDKDSHAWFIGCGEDNGKKLVVSVIVEGGGSGGRVAAPLAKDVMDAYFETR